MNGTQAPSLCNGGTELQCSGYVDDAGRTFLLVVSVMDLCWLEQTSAWL